MPGTVAAVVTAVGVDAGTAAAIGSVVAPALTGAGIGAGIGGITSAVEGGNIGQGLLHGAEGGALTGGGIGIGGDIGSAIGGSVGGVSAGTIGDVLGGAAGGALGGEATHTNPLTGALEGAVSGGISSQLSGSPTSGAPSSTSSAGAPGGGVSGAAAGAAPSSVPDASTFIDPNNPTGLNVNAITGSSGTPLSSVAQQPAVSGTGGINTGGNVTTEGFNTDVFNSDNSISPTPSSQSPALSTNSASLVTNNSAPATSNVGNGTVGTQGIPNNTPSSFGGSPGPTVANDQLLSNTGTNPLTGNVSAPSTGGTSSPSFLQGALTSLNKNALPLTIAGGGLALDAIKSQQAIKGENQIKSIAGQEATQGNLLQSYLTTGTLPPGLQAGLNQAAQAAEASIRSHYASMGMSGSSAEQQDLSNLQETVQGQGAQMALNLLQTGINETGMASNLYESLINETLGKDNQLGSAISNFASAAAGGTGNGGLRISQSGAGGNIS
jgi:hypothetical protein